MPSEVSASLRQLIAERAAYRCEYCQLPQAAALHRHEPDHIVPRQHGGETHEIANLYVCDPSVFPTAVSVDPSETIIAFSHVAADGILARGVV